MSESLEERLTRVENIADRLWLLRETVLHEDRRQGRGSFVAAFYTKLVAELDVVLSGWMPSDRVTAEPDSLYEDDNY